MTWEERAACRGTDTEAFYPEQNDRRTERLAKRVCGRCMVRRECLAHALRLDEQFGIWGGLTPGARKRLRRKAELTTRMGLAA